jgi:hypothetical protein
VYATARQYNAAANEYHARPGDDAIFSIGDNDFTIAAWVYFDTIGAWRSIASKYGGSGYYEYYLVLHSTNIFRFAVSANGTNVSSLYASTFGAVSINTWYLAVVWLDSTASTINIQINDGATDSAVWIASLFDGAFPFELGRHGSGAGEMNGRIGPTMFWKSAAGGGGVLTAAQRTALYNAGAGLPYESFTA